MEHAYYVEVSGSTFIVMRACPGEPPVVVGGPYWTAIAAWKDAEHRATESDALIIAYTAAPDYVPRNGPEHRAAWVVTPCPNTHEE